MPLQRNNDQERAERVERLVDELRHRQTQQQPDALAEKPTGAEPCRQFELRRGRSDLDLRHHQAELQREWSLRHRRLKRAKAP